MGGISAFVAGHKVVTAVAVLAVTASGTAFAAEATAAPPVTVVRIVDGDTIDVARSGQEQRVRLLNIDTPESVDPNRPVQCMGPEATDFLLNLLPVGTEVRLAHDEERYDQYDRELAAVYLDDLLVNAEIARAGLGKAIVVGDNDRFYAPVRAAQDEAADDETGLYSPDVECTVPGQLSEFESATAAAEENQPAASADSNGLRAHAGELGAVLMTGSALQQRLHGNRSAFPLSVFTAASLDQMASTVGERIWAAAAELREVRQQTRSAEQSRARREAARRVAEVKVARQAAEEEAARVAAEAEAARVAAEAEAARVAAEAEAARQAAAKEAERQAEAARQAAEQREAQRSSGASGGGGSSGGFRSSGSSGSSGSSDGYDGYTGCRAYGSGGTSVDEKGRRYTKIACP